MLFIILIVLIFHLFFLLLKLSSIEAENLGKISSLKLELKKKEEEIDNLKRKIKESKYNFDVDV